MTRDKTDDVNFFRRKLFIVELSLIDIALCTSLLGLRVTCYDAILCLCDPYLIPGILFFRPGILFYGKV
jgi:hypothetical protein